uniref:Uncharacterized protein n=1 Tax=Sus scrofa TaxID=9823 RepID=A0A8D2C966_PIG
VQLAAAEGRTGPLRIVVLVLSVGLTWILVSILFGGPGSGFPRIQQLFASECPPWEGPRGGRGGCSHILLPTPNLWQPFIC